MKTITTSHDVAEHLGTTEEVAADLAACIEDAEADAAFIAKALSVWTGSPQPCMEDPGLRGRNFFLPRGPAHDKQRTSLPIVESCLQTVKTWIGCPHRRPQPYAAQVKGWTRTDPSDRPAGSLPATRSAGPVTMSAKTILRSGRSMVAALAATAGLLAEQPAAQACSRILWNNNGLAVIVGRTMDWPESTQPVLTVLPRGMKRDGGLAGGQVVVKDNPARWTSKYGSMVTTVYGIGTADGFNEPGLGVHMLYLRATDFGPRNPAKPGVQAGLWSQYLLDNAATVKEALALLDTFQVTMVEANGHKATVHLAIEDATGDSAIIEYLNGKPVVHHGPEYRIMTNDPTYEEQLALLRKQDFSKPSSDTPLPSNVKATDRFQRAAYYTAMLPKPKNERQAVASVLAIARNISVPFGAPYRDFGIYNTEYRTAMNLTDKRYVFELTTSPNEYG
ncbi:linear amide C-N hydrolase [Cyanobium sp. FGCU-52]|nr:linear amide C-N hydrolase [Cyanobium sp. FGCU52]